MNYVLIVALREIVMMLRRPTFYLTTFVMPLFIGGLFAITSTLATQAIMSDGDTAGAGTAQITGYVDRADVIQTMPDQLHGQFQSFGDEAAAAAAMRADQISSYFVIESDYLETGRVVRVGRQASITSLGSDSTEAFETLLRTNLIGDPAVAIRLTDPLSLDTTLVDQAEPGAGDDGTVFSATFGLSFGLALLLAFAILNGGGWLIQAVAEEKENRTVEIVLTSLRPWQLMTGKLLGLGAISLLQLAVWLGAGGGLLGFAAALGSISSGALSIGVWLWAIVFFLLGFLFVGSLMAAVGAVGGSIRESGQLSTVLTLPVLAPLWFSTPISDQPNGTLAQVLSLIPFTAPVTMMLRLGEGGVPAWQVALSAALLALCVLGAIALSARLFRATILLTGARPTPRMLWRAVRGR